MVPAGYRVSPIRIETPVLSREFRDGWEIVAQYEDEGDAPWLIDLSHAQKFEYGNPPGSSDRFLDLSPPEKPGQCRTKGGFISSRLNDRRSLVLNLSKALIPPVKDRSVTDVTDAFALLAMIGHPVFDMMERVTSLEVFAPGKRPPFILQGPVLRVQSLLMNLTAEDYTPVVLFAVPRGYGQSFSMALLEAGKPWHLSPAGETVFFEYFRHITL